MKGRIEIDNMFWIFLGILILVISLIALFYYSKAGKEGADSGDCAKEKNLYCIKEYVLGDSPSRTAVEDACSDVDGSTTNDQMKEKCKAIGVGD